MIAAAEADLLRANEELERRVEARTEELRRAKDAAEQASRAKGDFLANMSHEVRTPMAAVQGYAELLLDDDIPPAERRSHARTILRSGRHLMSILDDILDLSKIEAGKMTVERIACSPRLVLHEVASLMQVRAAEKKLGFEVRFETPIPSNIQSDPGRIRQILLNLVGNAVKFTTSGAVRIVARCDDPGSADPKLRVDVSDTGAGLTPDQISRLFQPFTQADTSVTRRFGGTGLGLTICRRLASLLGGEITVTSVPGHGCTFTLELGTGPLAGVPMDARFHDGEAAPSSGSSKGSVLLSGRILLAEDGIDNQRLISLHLRRAGAGVTVVDDGRCAVEAALAAPFDLIFMDMQMPDVDGYQATAKLRSAGYRGPIVALTAHAMSTDRARCLAAGCSDFLTKPVRRDDLLVMAARHMGGAGAPEAEPLESDLADDPEMAELIELFVEALPERARAIQLAGDHDDVDHVKDLAHQLKGTAGGFGFPRIMDAAAALERAAAEGGGPGALEQRIDALVDLCARVTARAGAGGRRPHPSPGGHQPAASA
jgi:CheY-like chemotaxis protein/HPt (histidine-containing phosphotransfer) domain-containing protein